MLFENEFVRRSSANRVQAPRARLVACRVVIHVVDSHHRADDPSDVTAPMPPATRSDDLVRPEPGAGGERQIPAVTGLAVCPST
jgi:hypothetical protein